jgi:hypothetical protein
LNCGNGSRLISICGTSGGIEPATENKITHGTIMAHSISRTFQFQSIIKSFLLTDSSAHAKDFSQIAIFMKIVNSNKHIYIYIQF